MDNQSYTGQEINGYRIGPLLGVGGMGEVYQAFTSDNDQPVAIKFLRKDYTSESQIQARFVREIRIMESLDHPHIVPILDYGQHEGQLYYTMRLIGGMSLSTMLKRKKFSPLAFWKILRQLTAGLEFAHNNNAVHRDIKPGNIFIERTADNDLHLYLGDFGLGKREGQDMTLTDAGAIIGTPHYLAPETIIGERPSHKSDIYAVAVLTYRATTGKLPFNDQHAHRVAMAHVTRPVPLPTSLNPDFPPILESIILTGMAKKPADRHDSIREFADSYLACIQEMDDATRTGIYYAEDADGEDAD